MRASSLVAVLLFLNGCVSFYTSYSKTTDKFISAKSESCDFKIQTTLPDPKQFEEIGVVNGCSVVNDINDYKNGIRDKVCKASGDLVVGQIYSNGVYCIGTVFSMIK